MSKDLCPLVGAEANVLADATLAAWQQDRRPEEAEPKRITNMRSLAGVLIFDYAVNREKGIDFVVSSLAQDDSHIVAEVLKSIFGSLNIVRDPTGNEGRLLPQEQEERLLEAVEKVFLRHPFSLGINKDCRLGADIYTVAGSMAYYVTLCPDASERTLRLFATILDVSLNRLENYRRDGDLGIDFLVKSLNSSMKPGPEWPNGLVEIYAERADRIENMHEIFVERVFQGRPYKGTDSDEALPFVSLEFNLRTIRQATAETPTHPADTIPQTRASGGWFIPQPIPA